MIIVNRFSFVFFNFNYYNYFYIFLNCFLFLKKNHNFFISFFLFNFINFKLFINKFINIKKKKINFQKTNKKIILDYEKKFFDKNTLSVFFNYNYFNEIKKKKVKKIDFFFFNFLIFFKKKFSLNFFFFNFFKNFNLYKLIFKRYLFLTNNLFKKNFQNFFYINFKSHVFFSLNKNISLI